MHRLIGQQPNRSGRIARIAMVISRAFAIVTLLIWAPSLIGSANGNGAPAAMLVAPTAGEGAKETPVDPADGTQDSPPGPTCAKPGAIASAPQGKMNSEVTGGVGCGVGNNLAGGDSAMDQSHARVDLATLLAWHEQARTGTRGAFLITPSARPM